MKGIFSLTSLCSLCKIFIFSKPQSWMLNIFRVLFGSFLVYRGVDRVSVAPSLNLASNQLVSSDSVLYLSFSILIYFAGLCIILGLFTPIFSLLAGFIHATILFNSFANLGVAHIFTVDFMICLLLIISSMCIFVFKGGTLSLDYVICGYDLRRLTFSHSCCGKMVRALISLF